ncbi:MAG: hypothetical protein Q4G59_04445, partial [Planctomycetia bacterium]|nr:hypothetical protein [Planctomycetia bacterium]
MLPRITAEMLLKKRRIIYERFRCVILCLDAFAYRFFSGKDEVPTQEKLDVVPISNPRDDIEKLISLIIPTCSQAYELVEWHLTELITAYLRCCTQPDELSAACEKVLNWIEKLTPQKTATDQFAVRHMICKIFARVNSIVIDVLDEHTNDESCSPDFISQVDHLFTSARRWHRSNAEPEDVMLLAD